MIRFSLEIKVERKVLEASYSSSDKKIGNMDRQAILRKVMEDFPVLIQQTLGRNVALVVK